MEVRSAPDAEQLAREAAAFIVDTAGAAVRERGRFCFAVSGGSTPAKLFTALAELEVPWPDVHLFQVDERIAPFRDPDRNLGDLAANLLERVDIPWRNVHLMPVDAADPAGAAELVAEDLERACAGVLDLVHLGLGDDGHTASWPPGHGEVANVDVRRRHDDPVQRPVAPHPDAGRRQPSPGRALARERSGQGAPRPPPARRREDHPGRPRDRRAPSPLRRRRRARRAPGVVLVTDFAP